MGYDAPRESSVTENYGGGRGDADLTSDICSSGEEAQSTNSSSPSSRSAPEQYSNSSSSPNRVRTSEDFTSLVLPHITSQDDAVKPISARQNAPRSRSSAGKDENAVWNEADIMQERRTGLTAALNAHGIGRHEEYDDGDPAEYFSSKRKAISSGMDGATGRVNKRARSGKIN